MTDTHGLDVVVENLRRLCMTTFSASSNRSTPTTDTRKNAAPNLLERRAGNRRHFLVLVFCTVCHQPQADNSQLQCESKKSPLGFSENFSQTVGNLLTIFYTPIMLSFMH